MPTALQELALLARGAQVANPVGSFLQGRQAATQLQQQGAAFNQQSALNDLRLRTGEAALTQNEADLLRAAELRRALGAAVNGSPTGLADLARLGEDGLAAASSLQNLQFDRNAESRAQAAEGRAARGEQRAVENNAVDRLFRAESLGIDRERLALSQAAGERESQSLALKVQEAERKLAAGPKLTEGQRKFQLFTLIADDATESLDTLLAENPEFNATSVGRGFGDLFGADERRRYVQAQNQWSTGFLRATSGAAITQEDIESTARTFWPRIGDGPEVVSQMKQAREAVERGMRLAGGAADAQADVSRTEDPGVLVYNPQTGEFE